MALRLWKIIWKPRASYDVSATLSFPWRQRLRGFVGTSLWGLALTLWGTGDALSQTRHFVLNQDMIEGISTSGNAQACSPNEVLGDLFKQISPVVTIYPTENYFYFGFYRAGKSYSGSIRLGIDTRDKGILQFACYETYTSWLDSDSQPVLVKDLSKADGVLVTKLGALQYSVEFNGVTVKFLLNNISQTPDTDKLGTGDHFAGRSFDESGLVFDIIYHKPAKAFFFALDTKHQVHETFVKIKRNIYVGKRTGFVFLKDLPLSRFILIAVHVDEVHKNSPYDGPFDQLPENFYGESAFWEYVFDAYPDVRGKLTAGGSYRGSDMIFAIMPYRMYASTKGLKFIDVCMRKHKDRTKLRLCLTGERRR